MKRSTPITLLMLFAVIPVTLILGTQLPGRWYYLTATLIIAEMLVPFFIAFEGRRPQARELVVLAVLCALAVAARAAIPIPNFKAIFAVIMLAGIAFGPQSGFLVGAVSALASNFFFGQGPYTPWQMLAYGVGGLLLGFLFGKGRLPRKPWVMALTGGLAVLLLVGPLLDTCTFFLAPVAMNMESTLAVYASGLPVNISQSLSTALILFLLGRPLLEKLERIQLKYGMMEACDGI